jgi:iron(III) transport system ATP-binding protein
VDSGRTVALSIRDLTKVFRAKEEKVTALAGVSLEVREGELFTLLGPSGCGKTTTLRCIAGFEKPTAGAIDFKGQDFVSMPPYRRNIGMVFQSYALFPHLSVYENVAYGLKVRKVPRAEVRKRVREILALVGLEGADERKPGAMSGGQQQRVALARALVYDPKLLLLDEPLSNLDAKLRVYMREEIRRIQQKAGVTAIYVTHDQEEALSISDRVAVMHAGEVSQIGTPDEVFDDPANVRVADFIGQANFLPCRVRREPGGVRLAFPSGEELVAAGMPKLDSFAGEEGILFVRPRHLSVRPRSATGGGLAAVVKSVLYLGSHVRYYLEPSGGNALREVLVDEERRVAGAEVGAEVTLVVAWEGARLFPPEQRAELGAE